jgi:hypothetical protein
MCVKEHWLKSLLDLLLGNSDLFYSNQADFPNILEEPFNP